MGCKVFVDCFLDYRQGKIILKRMKHMKHMKRMKNCFGQNKYKRCYS